MQFAVTFQIQIQNIFQIQNILLNIVHGYT